MNAKCYVVTTLIETEDETKVNVISVNKDEEKAKEELENLLEQVEENYENNEIAYSVDDEFDTRYIVNSECETITIEYQESEVLVLLVGVMGQYTKKV